MTEPQRFVACSVVLRRGVIVYDKGRETLFIRSYLHSAKHAEAKEQGVEEKEAEEFVNLVPHGGVRMSFASDTIWFPLETTQLIDEPESYVVLDILTPERLNAKELPQPFQVEKSEQMKYHGETYHVARVTAKLPKQKTADLKIKP